MKPPRIERMERIVALAEKPTRSSGGMSRSRTPGDGHDHRISKVLVNQQHRGCGVCLSQSRSVYLSQDLSISVKICLSQSRSVYLSQKFWTLTQWAALCMVARVATTELWKNVIFIELYTILTGLILFLRTQTSHQSSMAGQRRQHMNAWLKSWSLSTFCC